jgi:hypothetical protein
MPEHPETKKSGPPEKEETLLIRMAVSVRVYEYLSWLKRNTMLGASENDVARYVLTDALKAMRKDGYSESDLAERKTPAANPS